MNVWDLPVGPRFFETLNIPLSVGRTIGPRDTAASAPVAVVNQTFVNEYFPGVNPLGQHMEDGAPFKAPGSEIVGVVGDSKFFDVREKPKQRWLESFLFGVRRLDPMALSASVLLIAGIALLAGYLPARRAANIDPMQALRHE